MKQTLIKEKIDALMEETLKSALVLKRSYQEGDKINFSLALHTLSVNVRILPALTDEIFSR